MIFSQFFSWNRSCQKSNIKKSRCIFTNFQFFFLGFFLKTWKLFDIKVVFSNFFFCWKNKRFSIGILPETSCVDVTNRHNSSLQIFCAKENSRASLLFENLIFHRSLEWFMFIRQNFSIFSGEDDDEKFDCCGFLRNNIKVEQEPL